jgi:hypothetical protein
LFVFYFFKKKTAALHVCCASKKDSKIILFFIEKGSDIYVKNKKGNTPLDLVNSKLRGLMRATYEVRELKIKILRDELKLQEEQENQVGQNISAKSF